METETVTLPVSEIQRLLEEQGKTTGRNCWIITFRPTWARTFPGEQAHLMVPKTQSCGCQWSCLIICSGVLWKSNKNASGGCRGGEGTTNGLSFLPGPLCVALCVCLAAQTCRALLPDGRQEREEFLACWREKAISLLVEGRINLFLQALQMPFLGLPKNRGQTKGRE